jgi:thioglycine synthase
MVPAADVLFPYRPPVGILKPCKPSTTGLASGNTHGEAILHALFEVIERDASSRFFIDSRGKLLDLNSIKGSVEKRLVNSFLTKGVRLFIVDLSCHAILPTFLAFTLDSSLQGPKAITGGQDTHLDPKVALRRALTEAAQSRIVAIQGRREDLIRHSLEWNLDYDALKSKFDYTYNVALSNGYSTFNSRPVIRTCSVSEILGGLGGILEESKYPDIIYTDLTDSRLGIPVVHIIVPGMVDRIVDPKRGCYI